jgi:hypothetical protein
MAEKLAPLLLAAQGGSIVALEQAFSAATEPLKIADAVSRVKYQTLHEHRRIFRAILYTELPMPCVPYRVDVQTFG